MQHSSIHLFTALRIANAAGLDKCVHAAHLPLMRHIGVPGNAFDLPWR